MLKIKKNQLLSGKISDLHYRDIEPYILNGFLMYYLFYEYVGSSLPFFTKVNFIPVFTVVAIKLLLNKIDKLGDNEERKVGYLTDMIAGCMKKKIYCNELKIFSYDSAGFYHAIEGKDFYADRIVVLINKNAYEKNTEIVKRWNGLIEKKKTKEVIIKVHEYERIFFGMTFDNLIGIFGCFKPECIFDFNKLASTKNTYSCLSRRGEAERQIIEDFNDIFTRINDVAETLSEQILS